MLSWKEYPRQIGGLSKYLSWFKDFKRPAELQTLAKEKGKEKMAKLSLFGSTYESTGKMSSTNFEQGSVGDNYLLTVMAAMADKNLIPQLFTQKQYTKEGIFTVKAYVKGRQEDITIDDQLPVYSHTTAFAKPSADGGWWMPLIEKAFAKVHVNYEMISSGTQAEAARFLTGSPAREFILNSQLDQEIAANIDSSLRRGYIVTAACFNDWQGLVAGNGYIVKSITQVNTRLTLVKVKNVFRLADNTDGASQPWKGRFNRRDTASWKPELKTQFKLKSLKPEEFYMTLEDFKSGFKSFTVTYKEASFKSSFLEKRSSVSKRLYKINFVVPAAAPSPAPTALAEEPEEQRAKSPA